jgi:Archaeal TRASH domain
MVNDAFMGRKQFPVPVGNKIYYGCCENCVDKLQKSDKYRYGIDPLTKEKVDKVDAYIVRQSDKNYAVFYFKSKENYEKYLLEKSS